MSRQRCRQQLDGLIRPTPNIPKAVNGALRWCTEDGDIPYGNLAVPHMQVAPIWHGASTRYFDTTGAPVQVYIRAMLAQTDPHQPGDVVDTSYQGDALIGGVGIDPLEWNLSLRETMVDGELLSFFLLPEWFPGTGKGIIHVFKDFTDDAVGSMTDFCWGPGPGSYS